MLLCWDWKTTSMACEGSIPLVVGGKDGGNSFEERHCLFTVFFVPFSGKHHRNVQNCVCICQTCVAVTCLYNCVMDGFQRRPQTSFFHHILIDIL